MDRLTDFFMTMGSSPQFSNTAWRAEGWGPIQPGTMQLSTFTEDPRFKSANWAPKNKTPAAPTDNLFLVTVARCGRISSTVVTNSPGTPCKSWFNAKGVTAHWFEWKKEKSTFATAAPKDLAGRRDLTFFSGSFQFAQGSFSKMASFSRLGFARSSSGIKTILALVHSVLRTGQGFLFSRILLVLAWPMLS